MKSLFKLKYLLLAATIAVFAACSGDDDGSPAPAAQNGENGSDSTKDSTKMPPKGDSLLLGKWIVDSSKVREYLINDTTLLEYFKTLKDTTEAAVKILIDTLDLDASFEDVFDSTYFTFVNDSVYFTTEGTETDSGVYMLSPDKKVITFDKGTEDELVIMIKKLEKDIMSGGTSFMNTEEDYNEDGVADTTKVKLDLFFSRMKP